MIKGKTKTIFEIPHGYEWIEEYIPADCKFLDIVAPIYVGECPHRFVEGWVVYSENNIVIMVDEDTCYVFNYNNEVIPRERY